VDHADPQLEGSAQSVRHHVWRTSARVKPGYTVNLTPSRIHDYLPISYANREEEAYIRFLWDAFETNYKPSSCINFGGQVGFTL
jgi:hypothetical protein